MHWHFSFSSIDTYGLFRWGSYGKTTTTLVRIALPRGRAERERESQSEATEGDDVIEIGCPLFNFRTIYIKAMGPIAISYPLFMPSRICNRFIRFANYKNEERKANYLNDREREMVSMRVNVCAFVCCCELLRPGEGSRVFNLYTWTNNETSPNFISRPFTERM